MKKLFTVLAIASMATFIACGPSAEEKAAQEKRIQDSIAAAEAAIEQAKQDSIAAAQASADTTAQAADTTKKEAKK